MKVNALKLIIVFVIAAIGLTHGQKAYVVKDYAVLISGRDPGSVGSYGGGERLIFDEFWNDTYLMWEIHYRKTGMKDSSSSVGGQIRVLYADGADYFDAQPRYQASWNNVTRITESLPVTQPNLHNEPMMYRETARRSRKMNWVTITVNLTFI